MDRNLKWLKILFVQSLYLCLVIISESLLTREEIFMPYFKNSALGTDIAVSFPVLRKNALTMFFFLHYFGTGKSNLWL